ncbi:MAG: MipA/OmpV family protein [Desulfobulbaceae bacterium]|nr:MipA/OmpV family protein [Desulfobulbaceae bacterium]
MRKKFPVKALVLAGILAGSAVILPCQAAHAAGFIDLDFENVPGIIGMGVGTLPDYTGSDEYTFGAAPFFRYTFYKQERYVQLIANELTVNVLDDKMFRFGPLLNYRFGRDDSVEDQMVSKMEEIDGTIEAGAFMDIVWANASEKRQRFIVGAKVYQDVGDVSDGFRANLNARYWYPVAKPVDLNISAGIVYQDDKYADCYFGVNPGNVGTSGLSFFTADGGVNEYYALVGANIYLNKNWLVSMGIRGSSLVGDPADSPIVEQRGDATQWMGGIGIGYIMW